MKEVVVLVGFLVGTWVVSEYFLHGEPGVERSHPNSALPLFLTPLISSGQIGLAKKQALVGSPFNRKFERSYSGFITVNNATCSLNLFFWFFLSKNNPSVDPVILFLDGGPGDPSSAAVFQGAGPFVIENYHGRIFLNDNPHSWNDAFNVIFIDSPVGTGFSFTNDACYATTLRDVAEALYEFLTQFYNLFSEYKTNPLFLSGVNYSAKDALQLAHIIYERNSSERLDINLKGLFLGNPFIDPPEQLDHSEFLYQLGLVDRNDRDYLAKEVERIKGDWLKGDKENLNPYEFQNHLQKISQITGGVSNLNYIKDEEDYETQKSHVGLFQEARIRHALHVGDAVFTDKNSRVVSALEWTLMEPVKQQLESVLDAYNLIVYSGQLDVTIPYCGLAKCFNGLNWSHVEEYRSAERPLYEDSIEVGAFVKGYGHFFECMVKNAGHYVYKDNPEHMKKILRVFTSQKKIETLLAKNQFEERI